MAVFADNNDLPPMLDGPFTPDKARTSHERVFADPFFGFQGHLEMEDGSSKRVIHEFYEKYDGLEGLGRFLREWLFNFFYRLYGAMED
ncbi:hypothetical protein GPALN_007818 [Globodera pallida]|nr:hypothetical protein GPALN_007818 [Globodera pallida]